MVNEIVGSILIGLGALFYFFAGLGVFRMPDVYNRLQAGTKGVTLGTFSLVLGAGIYNPNLLGKAIFIIIFVALTSPVASSVMAKASLKSGVKPVEGTTFEKLGELDGGDSNDKTA